VKAGQNLHLGLQLRSRDRSRPGLHRPWPHKAGTHFNDDLTIESFTLAPQNDGQPPDEATGP